MPTVIADFLKIAAIVGALSSSVNFHLMSASNATVATFALVTLLGFWHGYKPSSSGCVETVFSGGSTMISLMLFVLSHSLNNVNIFDLMVFKALILTLLGLIIGFIIIAYLPFYLIGFFFRGKK